jgi:hypothetical protein
VVKILGALLPERYHKYIDLYTGNRKFLNYCFVCGVLGVAVNMIVLYSLVNMLPLWLANGAAILAAMANNYYLTVGPLGYLFEFAEKEGKK